MASVSHVRPAAVSAWTAVTGAAAASAGWVTGKALGSVRAVPGVGGAAAVSVCVGEIASHVFHHGLAPWVAGLVAGCFGLLLDRRL